MSETKVAEIDLLVARREALKRDARMGDSVEVATYSSRSGTLETPGTPDKYIEPNIPLDLSEGLASVSNEDLIEGVDASSRGFLELLQAIEANDLNLDGVHFVSFRNNLTKILSTPFSDAPWEIDIDYINGIIVLGVVKTAENLKIDNEEHKKAIFWGYRFEDLCTGHVGAAFKGPELRDKFCTLNRVKVGSNILLLGAEVDCADETKSYVELKTARLDAENSQTFKRSKLLSVYIQSKTINVPSVIFGYRDPAGVVRKIQKYSTDDLPKLGLIWNPKDCATFGAVVLNFLRNHVKPGFHYRLKFPGKDSIFLFATQNQPNPIPSSFSNFVARKRLSTPTKAQPLQEASIDHHSFSLQTPASPPRRSSRERADTVNEAPRIHRESTQSGSRLLEPSHSYNRLELSSKAPSDKKRENPPPQQGFKRSRDYQEPFRSDRRPPSETDCRYGRLCTRRDCIFLHPDGREIDSAQGGVIGTLTNNSNIPSALVIEAPAALDLDGPRRDLNRIPAAYHQQTVRSAPQNSRGSIPQGPAYPSLLRKR